MHFRAIFISTTTLAASLALALVLWRGGIVTREGVMLIGTLTVFMNYAQGMMEPIQWLVQALSSLVNVQVNVEALHHAHGDEVRCAGYAGGRGEVRRHVQPQKGKLGGAARRYRVQRR